MVSSKISPTFALTIPKEIRLALNLQPGDNLEFFIQEDGSIVLKKEITYTHHGAQVTLPAIEWIYEEEEECPEEGQAYGCPSTGSNSMHYPCRSTDIL